MSLRIPRVLAAALSMLALLAITPVAPASAVVTWNPGAPTLVYTPTGPAGSDGQTRYYGYAPSVVEAGTTTRIFTCHNTASGVIEDDVFATKFVSGSKVSDASVLTRSASGWDSFHVCDPSVIRVDARLGGVDYQYAMFYLGNDVDASAHNQVGVAYATSLDGPWVKNPTPLVTFTGADTSKWGAGQPSATTIDANAGTALLFWTEGYGGPSTTKTYRAEVDLDGPSGPVIGTKLQVTANGLTGTDGSPDWLNNVDFAYDPSRDRFYAVRERHPYPSDQPDYIGSSLQVVSIAGSSIWGGGGTWTVEGSIDPTLTGFGRNHNAGITRTEYGTLPNASSLSVVLTTACGGCSDSLWQYKLYRVTGALTG